MLLKNYSDFSKEFQVFSKEYDLLFSAFDIDDKKKKKYGYGQIIGNLIKAKGYTLEEFSEFSEIPLTTLKEIRYRQRNHHISLEQALTIAIALKLPLPIAKKLLTVCNLSMCEDYPADREIVKLLLFIRDETSIREALSNFREAYYKKPL